MANSDHMTKPIAHATLHELAVKVLVAAGASEANAIPTADALIAAELDGLPSHGLSRLPFYADQIASGKVDGKAVPSATRPAASVIRVDAGCGLAFPAIDLGLEKGLAIVGETGIVAIGVGNSSHCGVAGHHVEKLALHGLVGLAFANTPAAIAPWGGKRGIFGTNPIAFACPRRAAEPLVIDLSMSVVARGKLLMAAQRGETIPEGWAVDRNGGPTTDPAAALPGTLLPIGGAKGAALALMVEILAAGLTGAAFGFEASSFFDAEGPPSRTGQLFLAIDPELLAGPGFAERIEALCHAMLADPAVRLPGQRRRAARKRLTDAGISVAEPLLSELQQRAQSNR